MCTVSNIGDYARTTFPPKYPHVDFPPTVHLPTPFPSVVQWPPVNSDVELLKVELANLKRDFEALKELLKAAKVFDEKTNQPDCEHADKVAWLKKAAELVGVDLSEVLG
jgi:hypothetical protein